MKSGRRSRDEALLAKIFAAREAEAASWQELKALAADFQGLTDITKIAARADSLQRQNLAQELLDRAEEQREAKIGGELAELEGGLDDEPDVRTASLAQLKARLLDLSRQANVAADSGERRLARRVL